MILVSTLLKSFLMLDAACLPQAGKLVEWVLSFGSWDCVIQHFSLLIHKNNFNS